MCEKFCYFKTNEEVKFGDNVEIKRFLRSKMKGIVVYIYDPNKPSIPRGENPIGYSIKINNNRELFVSSVDKSIALVNRKQ